MNVAPDLKENGEEIYGINGAEGNPVSVRIRGVSKMGCGEKLKEAEEDDEHQGEQLKEGPGSRSLINERMSVPGIIRVRVV